MTIGLHIGESHMKTQCIWGLFEYRWRSLYVRLFSSYSQKCFKRLQLVRLYWRQAALEQLFLKKQASKVKLRMCMTATKFLEAKLTGGSGYDVAFHAI